MLPSCRHCAAELKGQGGAYLQDCAVSKPYRNARSDKAAEQLWCAVGLAARVGGNKECVGKAFPWVCSE